jgi:prevent-host-death family protein
MRMITATEANRDFSKLLEQVVEGDTVKITKHGKVVATIIPEKAPRADLEDLKRLHMAELNSRVPIPGLQRGTRDELYED